ncbi:LOW QUALITY PROTEIN: uncharacterized protein LOC113511289 [Galleria mellonella]|uniref:LOW QUALITY PROTEIN: uncharacterized protein LOC113511289 n=1 Tax=Galleria mellonella TaxID=7137 RepID=A0A6J3C5X3_GALME|nr:LOW QUALITY PROTEIN: uncharacterized protein LOC113511289 [Galleria mellonella]
MLAYMQRRKRSTEGSGIDSDTKSDTVLFHHTIDEINEDILKNTNASGTIEASKMVANTLPQISRHTGLFDINNVSSPLHIEYKLQHSNHHIADNKIDVIGRDNKYYAINQENVLKLFNKTQKAKDKDLSKMIVNELKPKTEIVGDKKAPVISNITFTSENDTLTAMAFIAGNLLNKLWNIERDTRDESLETEKLKHEKITDLIELFEEPLSLRQEMFLKNVLEHLSKAVTNKDINNTSLCEKIKEDKKYLKDVKDPKLNENIGHVDCNKHTNEMLIKEQNTTARAIEKMSKVLELLQKFETVQKHLSHLKRELPTADKNKTNLRINYTMDEFLTRDETSSLNINGKILEKITKMIIPKKKSKKITNRIRNQNIFKNEDDIKAKLKDLYGVDLGNIHLTAKDKLIFDYLFNLKNQDCPVQRGNLSPMSNIEGNILLNLSEFFKVKSLTDLVKLLEPTKQNNTILRGLFSTTVPPITKVTIPVSSLTTLSSNSNKLEKLSKTKEKLKDHLKTIINDIIELQNASSIPIKDRKIQIFEMLPCIFNVLKKNFGELKSNKSVNPTETVKNLFEKLKNDFKYSPQTRRFNFVPESRPKSAVVWERVAKNLGTKRKLNTRRHSEALTKSYDGIRKDINKVDNSGSNVYKNQAIPKNVHPAKKLVLLKALNADIKQYVNVLENIQMYLSNANAVPADKTDLQEFIENAAINVNLNEKVLNGLNLQQNAMKREFSSIFKHNNVKNGNTRNQHIKLDNVTPSYNGKLKLSRHDIVNQLMKNRLQLYLNIKEAEGADINGDMNARIANKILSYLENGDNNLARDLYKIFERNKEQNRFEVVARSEPEFGINQKPEISKSWKEPIIQFEDVNHQNNPIRKLTKDTLLKQLLNIKRMKV